MSSFSQLRARERQDEEDDDADFDPNNPFYIAPPPQRIRPVPLNKPPALPVPYLAPLPRANSSRYQQQQQAPPTNTDPDNDETDLYDQNNPFCAPNPFGPPPARPIYAVPFTKL